MLLSVNSVWIREGAAAVKAAGKAGVDVRTVGALLKYLIITFSFICIVCAKKSVAAESRALCSRAHIIFHQNVQVLLRDEVERSVKNIMKSIDLGDSIKIEIKSFRTDQFTPGVNNKIADIPSWMVSTNYISGQLQGCIVEKHYKAPGEISLVRLQVEWDLRTLEPGLVDSCLGEALNCR